MLSAIFPSLWRTELSDRVLTWTKFGLIVLKNLLLPHCSGNKNRRNSLSSEIKLILNWDTTHLLQWVQEEHKHSTWIWIITLLQTQSTDLIACPGEQSSWMSVQLEQVKTFCLHHWWTSIANTTLPSGILKAATPSGFHSSSQPCYTSCTSSACKQRIFSSNTTACSFLTVTFIFPFKDKIASKLFQSISFNDFGNKSAQ